MKYVQINAYAGAWAESIVFGKHQELQKQGHESWVFWARGEHEQDVYMQKISTFPDICLDALLTRIDGKAGFHSKRATRKLLKKLDSISPDVVHLHVLLGYYINIEMLFEWLAARHCKVIWTLHDCWAFTGHCIHFTYAKCMQWHTQCAACISCPQKRSYPETYFGGDYSVNWSFNKKKHLFTMLPSERMRLITPSKWLADLVKQSFLAKYDVKVVHNTVDVSIFKPTPNDFRERYGIGERFLVLGVASKWNKRKGLSEFVKLAHELDPKRFVVVVVGLNKKQIRHVKDKIVAIPRTNNQRELAEIYTAADVLLNPSVEETYGMNVAEAFACGTRSIVIEGSACSEVAQDSISLPLDSCTIQHVIMKLEERT